MSTYPYVLMPQLLLDFMAAHSTGVGAVDNRSEQLPNRIPHSPMKTTPSHRQWLSSVRVQLKWVTLRYILVLLPVIILSYAALVSWILLGAFGNWGVLVLTGYGSGCAICLWQQRFAIALYFLVSRLDYTSNKSLTLPESPPRASTGNAVAVPSASSESVSLHRLKQLKKTLKRQVRQPSGISDAPVGASERDFNKVLEQYFPGRVQSQLKFPVVINGREYAYSIDFAIVFDEIGVCIDCEIDEPYDYKSRRPTHCIDQKSDAIRNSFFVEGNWIVIRFSEAQIVLHPHSCCKTIAKVVSRIMGSHKFLRGFENVPDLKPIPKWTKRQAKRMALARVRDRYLSGIYKRAQVLL